MRTTTSRGMDAPPELVFALVRDVERWPLLLPHYERATVVERTAESVVAAPSEYVVARPSESVVAVFVARRELVPLVGLGLPVAWRSRVWADERAWRLRFEHLGGATGGMEVEWRIEAADRGCRVTIEHDFGQATPLARFVERFFVRPIAARTLASVGAIAEALASAGTDAPSEGGGVSSIERGESAGIRGTK